jgi:predicted nucleic acid-binding protein
MLVLAKLHGHLLCQLGPEPARELVSALLEDRAHEWVQVGPDLAREALARWLSRLRGRRVSLTDALSFEVMRRERIAAAFAFDDDFAAAGFELSCWEPVGGAARAARAP